MAGLDEVLVSFRNVEKTYDGANLVVRDLDLDIYRGEFLTLLGPSGSGKTTTLMMLAGFEAPTRGTITLAGRTLANLAPHKRDIGMVFQNYALFPHMTVAENLAFPLSVRRQPKADIRSRVERALDMVQLSGFGGRRPGQLSGGQQQRVALARALVFEPQLVLMDEPLGALDKQLREQMQLEIKHIHQRLDVTVVYVTHDQGEALTMSDRIAVFNRGAIQQIDSPDGLYEHPRNSFVAHFIGENNTFRGQVESIDGDACAVILDSGVRVLALPVNVDGVGAQTNLSIRPEQVAVNPAADEYPNRFPAEVLEVIYLGDHMRARLSVAGNDGFTVKLPAAAARQTLRVGDSATVGWRADDCKALDPV